MADSEKKLADALIDEGDSLLDRARKLIKDYEHGLEHNSPRTPDELKELKAILDIPTEA
jgi:hypothetical protein